MIDDESINSFAQRIGVSQQTTHNYLSESRRIPLSFIISVCCNCQVSADWLLGFTNERTGTAAPVADAALTERIKELELALAEANARIAGLEFAFKALKR
jgi:hypothetical protein